jgi:lysophospholipase L1-like esterase
VRFCNQILLAEREEAPLFWRVMILRYPTRLAFQAFRSLLPALVGVLWLAGCASPVPRKSSPPPASASGPVLTIFMIGDSTMANKPVIPANPERGWGQMLGMYVGDSVRISNHARNGRSSKSFLDEGSWNAVLEQAKPGDYVIIQFGHNDEKETDPWRFTAPFGEFKQNLKRYIHDARQQKAVPILATPGARRRIDSEGKLRDTHGDYVVAARQVAIEERVPLLDLNKRSSELLSKMGPDQSKRLFDLGRARRIRKMSGRAQRRHPF